MERSHVKHGNPETIRYIAASFAYWAATLILAAVLFWFRQDFPIWTKVPLGALLLLLPIGWTKHRQDYRQLQELYLNTRDHFVEVEKLYGAAQKSMIQQIALLGLFFCSSLMLCMRCPSLESQ